MPITSKREWLQGPYQKAIERAPERSKSFETTGKMPIEPLYTGDDLAGFDPQRDLGFPGEYPFTRGIQPTMYRGRFWTMRQYAGFGDAEESNQRYRYLLAKGQTGLSVAFDLPTQIGYDSDDPMAAGEVGKVGVAIDSIDDMQTLFNGHPAGQGHHVDDDQRDGLDPARALCGRRQAAGCHAGQAGRDGPERHPQGIHRARDVHLSAEALACGLSPTSSPTARTPCRSGTRSRSPGYHMREAGCTAAQEIAFTLADGIAYVAGRDRCRS